MSPLDLPTLSGLAASEALLVEEQCKRFEAAWKAWHSGLRPALEDILQAVTGPARPVLLCELLRLDLAYRRQRGEDVTPGDYLARFPGDEDLIRRVLAVTIAHEATGPNHPSLTAPTPAELAPLFPQLEVLEQVGQGGMGIVYRARQKALDRLVALKVLPRAGGRTAQFAKRFEQEARALARLQHAGIVAVHDSGRIGDLYYLVMEYIEGRNLRQAVRDAWIEEHEPGGEPRPAVADGRVSPGVSVVIAVRLCEALEYAHARGVVHRDIKPENILLSAAGQIKIADFGLAKLLARGPEELPLTATQQVMGTLHYMAPEQLERPQQVDHRADIYSLGVVLYELLTGEVPLGRFPPPSQKAGIDARLDGVVFRALARDPSERFQQAAEFKAALEFAWSAKAPAGAAGAGKMPEWAAKMLGDIFGGSGQVLIQNPGGSFNIVTTAMGKAPPAHRHLPWRVILLASALALVGWVLTALLWNLGVSGLAASALGMLLIYLVSVRRGLRHLPEMAERLRAHDAPTRGLRWALAGGLFLAGCGALLFAPPLFQDARAREKVNEEYPLAWGDLRSRIYLEGEWVLPKDSRWFFTEAVRPANEIAVPVPRSRLHLRRRREGGPWHLTGTLVMLLGVGSGLLLLCLSTLAVPGGSVFWTAGVSLAEAVFLPFAVVHGVALFWGPQPSLGPPADGVSFAVGHDRLTDALHEWARTANYDLYGGSEWEVAVPKTTLAALIPEYEKRGLLAIYQARRAAPLERWDLAPGRLERRSPDLLVCCLSNSLTGRTWVWVVPVTCSPTGSNDGKEAASGLLHRLTELLGSP
jgi:hypothetical protein